MMITHTKDELKGFLSPSNNTRKTVGFVPTMGALHQGHLSLVQRALNENDLVVVSIFVNPTQFNNPEDLQRYPRNLEADVSLLKSLSPEVIVFAPAAKDLYQETISVKAYDFGSLTQFMEGQHRAGHFDGVATVVSLLFDAVNPDCAYFGEKDFQQLRVIQTLVQDQNLSISIVPCPIARNADGLALSSRNQRLTEAQKQQAALLYRVLEQTQKSFAHQTLEQLRKSAKQAFSDQIDFDLEYFEIADAQTLTPAINIASGKKYRAFIAAHFHGVRLIDNLELN